MIKFLTPHVTIIIKDQITSTMSTNKGESKFNDNNIFRVRKQSRLNQSIFLCKLILKKHGSIQIEGMGECISLVAKLSQILGKDKLANVTRINGDNVEGEKKHINPKLAIQMNKSADFDKLTENIKINE